MNVNNKFLAQRMNLNPSRYTEALQNNRLQDVQSGKIGQNGRIGQAGQIGQQGKAVKPGGDFSKLLQETIDRQNEVRFSKHAAMRMESRNISLTENQREKIVRALDRAESKGVRDSLVLMDNLAFVVNVKSRTVITAANADELKENVFTNIDGAVIV